MSCNQAIIEGLEIRLSKEEDGKYLKEWLNEDGSWRWFPMADDSEIDDAVVRWIGFHRYKCSLTAVINGVPAGIATLFLQPYRKICHQCEFGIIVGGDFQGQGIGGELIRQLMHLAKEQFRIELLHLQVYAENPAIRLYERMGFREFGRQTHWIKEKDGVYVGRIFMERFLT